MFALPDWRVDAYDGFGPTMRDRTRDMRRDFCVAAAMHAGPGTEAPVPMMGAPCGTSSEKARSEWPACSPARD